MEKTNQPLLHHGYNIRRLCKILEVKQDVIAAGSGISQQAISKLEKKSVIDDNILEKVSGISGVSIDVIKNYNDNLIESIIAKNFKN
jgi:transcriptional regulator with XRE-family HTH domain